MEISKSRSETPEIIAFRENININFEQMQKDRNLCKSDIAYARSCSVSVHTVIRYM
jgi:hypothetical protein